MERLLRGRGWLAFLAIVLLAVAWRMPYAATKPIVQVDEVKYSLPTVHRLLAGDPVFYVSGTNYGAPTQEALAALTFRAIGESAAAFRFPTVLLGALAAGLAFLALRPVTGAGIAFGMGLFLALANSADARYTTFSHPCYATLLAMVAALQITTLWLDGKRTGFRWLLLGVLMGAAFYVLKLALFQVVISLGWLWLRSDYFGRLRERLRDGPRARRLRVGSMIAGLGFLVMAPVLYHFLTRRAVYAASALESGLLVGSLLLFCLSAIVSVPALCAPRLREVAPVAGCLALFVLLPMPAERWFQRIEQPRLAAQGVEAYAETSYSLKHFHEWPNQARLVVEGIVPALLIGRWDEVRGFEETEHLGWKSVVAAAFLATLAAAAFQRRREGVLSLDWHRPDVLFIGPFLVTLVVLFPSWSLHSESSYRYLLPFLSGWFLLIYRCLEGWLSRFPRSTAALLAAYFAYCALDCFHHIA